MVDMKGRRKLLLMLVVTFLAGIISSHSVDAKEETDFNEIILKINEQNMKISSLEADGKVDLEIENLGAGVLELDFRYQLDPSLAIESNFQLIGEMVEYGGDGATEIRPIESYGPLIVKDRLAYYFNGYVWTVSDISKISKLLTNLISQIGINSQNFKSAEQLDRYMAFIEKYYDFTESDTDYIFQLKDPINREEFWQEAQAIQNITLNRQADQLISKPLEEWSDLEKEVYFLIFQQMETAYSKENFYISSIQLNMEANGDDVQTFASYFDLKDNFEKAEADWFKLNLKFDFSNHGADFDIQIPENAPEFYGYSFKKVNFSP